MFSRIFSIDRYFFIRSMAFFGPIPVSNYLPSLLKYTGLNIDSSITAHGRMLIALYGVAFPL